MSCIFCKIVKGEIPCLKVFETQHTLAFMDIQPIAEKHVLVIPKHHAPFLHLLPDSSMADLGPVLKKVAAGLKVQQYNVLQNNGKLAHQEVEHVHFHIIPKPNEKEGLGIRWPSTSPSKETLSQLAKEIEEEIQKLQ